MTNLIEGIRDGSIEARSDLTPKLEKAVVDYSEEVQTGAKSKLNRPKRLLSGRIGKSVKKYGVGTKGLKIWAMAGFTFKEKNNKRDSGYYGQFHEAGWRPNGKPSAPDHFLRRAKKEALPTLQKECVGHFREIARYIEKRVPKGP
ncbi:MAG: hypothetical protein IJM30_13435 [Thermoguttaceae bacterium]|nr:hypothetical protein [Thermoguttaceae bacterium]